jgi:hypothetical protein
MQTEYLRRIHELSRAAPPKSPLCTQNQHSRVPTDFQDPGNLNSAVTLLLSLRPYTRLSRQRDQRPGLVMIDPAKRRRQPTRAAKYEISCRGRCVHLDLWHPRTRALEVVGPLFAFRRKPSEDPLVEDFLDEEPTSWSRFGKHGDGHLDLSELGRTTS